MTALGTSRVPPSAQWTSFAGWDYNGMKERLQGLLANIDKSKVTMSQPFLAGQYWICFEMIAEDGSLLIARVRLPPHPDTPPTISEEDEQYSIQNVPAITLPQIYAYEGPGLITLAYLRISSISSVSITGELVIGRLANALAEGLRCHGPFSNVVISKLDLIDTGLNNGVLSFTTFSAFVFRDINILVDDRFNFRAIIDWEFAQTAPWQVNHYLMPFPLLELYTKKFRDAEVELQKTVRSLRSSFTEVLDSPASRIYACFTKLGRLLMADAGLVHVMVQLAFDLDAEGTERYLCVIGDRLKRGDNKAR
ncbi:hypothetical protein B0T16DRAFT_425256 [Cercophora newfieldiana]|uniref:Aminoglycoside phosphotransferase domain-containing protein n=1 Tax=Cercophora newfieldiana TaxID=92897 RepID=A0AA39YQG1_9PEZI|nr:hypothetical protein B0T16DRAFT_425256 [Cercophora newfieldiana]